MKIKITYKLIKKYVFYDSLYPKMFAKGATAF